jgi:propanol-preferring alcohol dehydrogenase
VRVAVLHEFGTPLAIEERPEPAGEGILVRVRGAGVCHTDVHLAAGRWPHIELPLVLGHEIAGEAPKLGPVLVYASWGCGQCDLCRVGDEQLCPNAAEAGWVRDGGYADFVRVPAEKYLFPLAGLDPVRAAPLADAGITPYRAVKRVSPYLEQGSVAVVIGCGGLGQFAVQYLKLLTSATVIAVDPVAGKRERALALGAEEAISPAELARPAEVVLDLVGTDETLAQAARVVKAKGVVVQIGEAAGTLAFALGRVPHEASFTTSIWGSLDDMRAVVDLATRGELSWDVETLPLERANEALERVRRGDVAGRLVLTP